MSKNMLERLIEHNNWANLLIIRACSALSDSQLDAEPLSATKGSIRTTLLHLVEAQQGYLLEMTPIGAHHDSIPTEFKNVEKIAVQSGDGLLALARAWNAEIADEPITTRDSLYTVEPWVLMLQVINHATEHREQIKAMLTALEVTPPRIDGWAFGRSESALISIDADLSKDV